MYVLMAFVREIDSGTQARDSKKAYGVLKTLTMSSQPRAAVIDDQGGNLLTDADKVLQRWTQYCEQLYNHQIQPDKSSTASRPILIRQRR